MTSLALPEATELLTGILGDRAASDGEPALTRLAQLCEGLPLALRIAGNRLVSRPGWDAAELAVRLADEERRLDQFTAGDLKVASAFAMSYELLADSARRVFRRLAVVPGRDFDAALAAVAGEMSAGDAWDALDELRPSRPARPRPCRGVLRGGCRVVAARGRGQLAGCTAVRGGQRAALPGPGLRGVGALVL